ncbi:MAG: hypothetical protein ACRD6W_03595, partial [Nitrososphaerales archaeon]
MLRRRTVLLAIAHLTICGLQMLSIVKLRDAEYVLRQIAKGIDEYYTSSREPPGVWEGRWSRELGLEGVV